jgi:hypothetical protein
MGDDPSPLQRYLRITELLYQPASAPELPMTDPQGFEFIELRNVGPDTLDLQGARFTRGVQFAFASGNITALASGQRVLLVRDREAFGRRFGPGLPVAGEYIGSLDNSGERLRLEDGWGEAILDFSYSNAWVPEANGQGHSLQIIDDGLPWSSWGSLQSWRGSREVGGSPGADEQPNRLSIHARAGRYHLLYTASPGQACEIQQSADLVQWKTLSQTNTSATGFLEYPLPSSLERQAYFRVLTR